MKTIMITVLILIVLLTVLLTVVAVLFFSRLGKVNDDVEHIYEEIAMHQKRVDELQCKLGSIQDDELTFMTPEVAEPQEEPSDLIEEKKAEDKNVENKGTSHKATKGFVERVTRFCKYRRQGMTIKQASEACGVSLVTGYRYDKVYLSTQKRKRNE